jgi:hypothetical protein
MRRSGRVWVKVPADPVQLPQGGPHRQVAHHSFSPLLVDVYQGAALPVKMRRSGRVRVKDPADPVQLPQGGPHRQVAHHSLSPLLVDV